MMLITEKIFDEMKTQHQNGHLILVGDGKTYGHLRKTLNTIMARSWKGYSLFPGDYFPRQTAAKVPKHGPLQLTPLQRTPLGLFDKNADSDDTMMLKIFDEMKTQHQNGHLILVRDGKTYEHLRKILH